MIRIPTERIDRFIEEDIPYIDLTSMILGIGDRPGRMEYFTRPALSKPATAAKPARQLQT